MPTYCPPAVDRIAFDLSALPECGLLGLLGPAFQGVGSCYGGNSVTRVTVGRFEITQPLVDAFCGDRRSLETVWGHVMRREGIDD